MLSLHSPSFTPLRPMEGSNSELLTLCPLRPHTRLCSGHWAAWTMLPKTASARRAATKAWLCAVVSPDSAQCMKRLSPPDTPDTLSPFRGQTGDLPTITEIHRSTGSHGNKALARGQSTSTEAREMVQQLGALLAPPKDQGSSPSNRVAASNHL